MACMKTLTKMSDSTIASYALEASLSRATRSPRTRHRSRTIQTSCTYPSSLRPFSIFGHEDEKDSMATTTSAGSAATVTASKREKNSSAVSTYSYQDGYAGSVILPPNATEDGLWGCAAHSLRENSGDRDVHEPLHCRIARATVTAESAPRNGRAADDGEERWHAALPTGLHASLLTTETTVCDALARTLCLRFLPRCMRQGALAALCASSGALSRVRVCGSGVSSDKWIYAFVEFVHLRGARTMRERNHGLLLYNGPSQRPLRLECTLARTPIVDEIVHDANLRTQTACTFGQGHYADYTLDSVVTDYHNLKQRQKRSERCGDACAAASGRSRLRVVSEQHNDCATFNTATVSPVAMTHPTTSITPARAEGAMSAIVAATQAASPSSSSSLLLLPRVLFRDPRHVARDWTRRSHDSCGILSSAEQSASRMTHTMVDSLMPPTSMRQSPRGGGKMMSTTLRTTTSQGLCCSGHGSEHPFVAIAPTQMLAAPNAMQQGYENAFSAAVDTSAFAASSTSSVDATGLYSSRRRCMTNTTASKVAESIATAGPRDGNDGVCYAVHADRGNDDDIAFAEPTQCGVSESAVCDILSRTRNAMTSEVADRVNWDSSVHTLLSWPNHVVCRASEDVANAATATATATAEPKNETEAAGEERQIVNNSSSSNNSSSHDGSNDYCYCGFSVDVPQSMRLEEQLATWNEDVSSRARAEDELLLSLLTSVVTTACRETTMFSSIQ